MSTPIVSVSVVISEVSQSIYGSQVHTVRENFLFLILRYLTW